MLELYYKFFTNFSDVNKFEELEWDKFSLYLALAEKELEECIRPEMKTECERLQNEGRDIITANASGMFSPEGAVTSTKNMISENLDFSKLNSDVQRCYVSVARRTAVKMFPRTSLNSVTKASTNVCYNRAAMVPLTSSSVSPMKKLMLRQQTEGFRKNNDSDVKYEHVKEGLSYFSTFV